jgi:putative ABC transport system substrate-binding protein
VKLTRRKFQQLAAAGAALGGRPLGAAAQQQKSRVIGFLTITPIDGRAVAFRRALSDAGFAEGQGLTIEYRAAQGAYEQLPAMMADLIARKADLILAAGPPAARAAKAATSSIPIVFVVGNDPVKEGLVASLARPGGNLTGIALLSRDLASKRLELASELVPHAMTIALLMNPTNPAEESLAGDIQQAVAAKGLRLEIAKASTEAEIDAAFTAFGQTRPGLLIVGNDSFFDVRREQIVGLARRAAIPAIYRSRNFVDAGGLISYGTDGDAAYHQAGLYAAEILKGKKPADLPVFQPTTFELIVNLQTARTLGLTMPPSVLARANEIVD